MAYLPLLTRLFHGPQRRTSRPSQQSVIETLEPREMLAGDLAFQSMALTQVSPTLGSQISLIAEFTVTNVGNQQVLAANVGVTAVLSGNYIYGDADDVPVGNSFLDINIAPGGTIEGLVIGNPQFSSYANANYLFLKVDVLNTVAEASEINNNFLVTLPRIPLLTASPGSLTGKLHKVHRVDPNITFTDADTTNFAGGGLTVRIENDEPGENILSFKSYKSDDGVVRRKKNELRIGKRVVGTVSGGTDGDSLFVTFTGSVSVQDVRRIAAGVSIKGTKGTPGVREVRFFAREADVVSSTSALKLVNLT